VKKIPFSGSQAVVVTKIDHGHTDGQPLKINAFGVFGS